MYFRNKKFKWIFVTIVGLLFICITFILINSNMGITQNSNNLVSDRLTKTYIKNHTDSVIKSSELKIYNDEGNLLESTGGDFELKNGKLELKEKSSEKKAEEFSILLEDSINNNKLKELYSYFSSDYLKDFDYDFDTFVYDYTFNGKVEVEYKNFEEISLGDFSITLLIKEIQTGDMKVKDFIITKNGEIRDKGLYEVTNKDSYYTVDDMTFNLSKIYKGKYENYFIMNIVNESQYVLDIKDMYMEQLGTVGVYEVYSYPRDLKIYPGIDRKIVLKVFGIDNIDYLKLFINDINNIERELIVIDTK